MELRIQPRFRSTPALPATPTTTPPTLPTDTMRLTRPGLCGLAPTRADVGGDVCGVG
ncbi:hypothetical protein GPOL_c50070 [Gordonia polyisoprenivorans VH2]|uniref:Uncharacterized protein n=1 Tax=Gordonia polyisoprenivorans (strain DSM 44266 / VH2) TaxID=1112204 RepID=H6N322_GORPV|nr:hypothetical protein GPOL_c50070 [Gordonia polyisoprenivorans VH2]